MILVVLSTHAELASTTARGRSYWETGQLYYFIYMVSTERRRKKKNLHNCIFYLLSTETNIDLIVFCTSWLVLKIPWASVFCCLIFAEDRKCKIKCLLKIAWLVYFTACYLLKIALASVFYHLLPSEDKKGGYFSSVNVL